MVCKPGSCSSARATSLRAFRAWDEVDAEAAIAEIAADAVSIVDPTTLWPRIRWTTVCRTGMASLYFGAAGVIWALDYLRRGQAVSDAHDLTRWQRPRWSEMLLGLPRQPIRATHHCSWVSSVYCWSRCVSPDQGLADEIYTLLASNSELPMVELMWGLPGCMLGCVHMGSMTTTMGLPSCFSRKLTCLLPTPSRRTQRSNLDAGPIRTATAMARTGPWLRGQHAATCSTAGIG